MLCRTCGCQLPDEAQFCMKCGASASTGSSRASAPPGGTSAGSGSRPASTSAAALGGPAAPRRSWWGRRGRAAKVALVFACLVVALVLVGVLGPLIADALRPSDAELVQKLATTVDAAARTEAAADLAARHSIQATQDLAAEAATDPTAQAGLAALRNAYIVCFGAGMTNEPLEEKREALTDMVQCLGLIGDAASVEALGRLSCTSECDLVSVRVAAVHTLGETEAAAALPHLIKALALPALVDSTGEIATAASAELLVFPDAVLALIEARAESIDDTVHLAIDKTLAGIGESAVEPLVAQLQAMDWTDEVLTEIGTVAIPAVAQELDSEEPIVRYRALGVLLRLYQQDTATLTPHLVVAELVPLLIEARSQAGYGDERDTAAQAVLAAIGEPAVEPLAALLVGTDWAGDTLAAMGEAAVPALLSALKSKDYDTRFAAADALVQMQRSNPESVASLMSALEDVDLKFIAQNYAFYIKLGQAGTEDVLIRALNKYGNADMCLDYLNCGNDKLDAGAREWAANHGYEVHTTPGVYVGPQWGEGA